jgi:hypothetical protein
VKYVRAYFEWWRWLGGGLMEPFFGAPGLLVGRFLGLCCGVLWVVAALVVLYEVFWVSAP